MLPSPWTGPDYLQRNRAAVTSVLLGVHARLLLHRFWFYSSSFSLSFNS
jgi:hypothetical protein